MAIRMMAGPGGLVLVVAAMAVAWYYPLTRDKHRRVVRALDRRVLRERAREERHARMARAGLHGMPQVDGRDAIGS
jgi:Na+/melibiose symporter-like transporter